MDAALKAVDRILKTNGRQVTVPTGAVDVFFVTDAQPILPAIQARIAAAPGQFILRLAGGCKNMKQAMKRGMGFWYCRNLENFVGLVSSGGTRELNSRGQPDPMITDIPAMLASDRIYTISTLPLMGTVQLTGLSQVRVYREGTNGFKLTYPNPGVHTLIVVQDPLGKPLGWDGDVRLYFDLFNSYCVQPRSPWKAGLIAWNGGSVTELEIKLAARYEWPVILVEGSGEVVDNKIIPGMRDGSLDLSLNNEYPVPYNPKVHHLHIVRRDEPYSLREKLIELGFITA